MKTRLLILLLLILSIVASISYADQYDADRHQMKQMLTDIQDKLNKKEFDSITQYLDKDAVITFYDARTVVGVSQFNDYLKKMVTGSNPILRSYSVEGGEDAPAKVFPNLTATAYGWTKNTFNFVAGEQVIVDGRWTVTLIKEGKDWKIVALHFSTNLFKNPLVKFAENKIIVFATIALLLGLIIGYFFRSRIGKN